MSMIVLTGCGHLFYHPDRIVHDDPKLRNIDFSDYYIYGHDKKLIHVRYFPSKSKKVWGVLWQFHGNAQNLSSHYGSVIWAIQAGLDVVTFDYRGYGQSEWIS